MSIVNDFKQFAMRGNIVDMAVGFTVGAAFSTIAKSLVDDLIMPVIGLVIGRADFSNLYILLKPGEKTPPPYLTVTDAHAAGAVTINYGAFVNNVIAFLFVAVAMFLILRLINKFEEQLENHFGEAKAEENTPANKKCPYCLSTIAFRATRCAHCTALLAKPSSSEAV
jgi:large conductance mechanosensitive channel